MKIPHNHIPVTWACECGQMNYFSDKECVCCGEEVGEAWAEKDMRLAIPSSQSVNPEAKPKVTGFYEWDGDHCIPPPHSDDPFYVRMSQ